MEGLRFVCFVCLQMARKSREVEYLYIDPKTGAAILMCSRHR